MRFDSPGDHRLVRSSGRPKAGRSSPGPGVLRVSFLTRGGPVPGHKFMHGSRASPAFGRASSGLSGHPGDTGAVGRDCATHRTTGHPGTRCNWVGRCLSADPMSPNDIHRVICCSLPPAPGVHRLAGAHRAGDFTALYLTRWIRRIWWIRWIRRLHQNFSTILEGLPVSAHTGLIR